MNLTLRPVTKKDYRFLYELLKQRPEYECISHHKVPSYCFHCKYQDTFPFFLNTLILVGKKRVGNFYQTARSEIGIHLIKEYEYLAEEIVSVLVDLANTDKKNIYFNINPKDKRFKSLLTKRCKLIQHTYENIY